MSQLTGFNHINNELKQRDYVRNEQIATTDTKQRDFLHRNDFFEPQRMINEQLFLLLMNIILKKGIINNIQSFYFGIYLFFLALSGSRKSSSTHRRSDSKKSSRGESIEFEPRSKARVQSVFVSVKEPSRDRKQSELTPCFKLFESTIDSEPF